MFTLQAAGITQVLLQLIAWCSSEHHVLAAQGMKHTAAFTVWVLGTPSELLLWHPGGCQLALGYILNNLDSNCKSQIQTRASGCVWWLQADKPKPELRHRWSCRELPRCPTELCAGMCSTCSQADKLTSSWGLSTCSFFALYRAAPLW